MRKILILIGTLTGVLLAGNCRAATTLPETPSGISVQVSTNGDYEIRSHEPAWAFGGSIGYPLEDIKTASGQDAIGAYQEVTFRWNAQFSAGIRSYHDKSAVLFSVNLPAGANAAKVAFPSFSEFPTNLHGFSYREGNFAPPSFKLEQNGTPWLLFDDAANTAVLSPAANFLVARLSGDGRTGITSGLNPEVGTLEKPFTHRSLLVFGRGVGATFETWGGTLSDLY